MYNGKQELHVTEKSQKTQANYFATRIFRIIINMNKENLKVLDFGAGTGHLSEILCRKIKSQGLSVDVTCLEVDVSLQEEIMSRDLHVIDKMEYNKKYDVIFSSHVLEHIEDDKKVLSNFYTSLNPDGKLFIIVPLHMSLWTQMDQRIGHYRRYSIAQMKANLINSGFVVDSANNFDSLGFLLAKLMIFLKRTDGVFKTSKGLRMIRIYDLVLLPISMLLDKLSSRTLPGRNGIFIASKEKNNDLKMSIGIDT
jgi:SAM-dependent methyltransferase